MGITFADRDPLHLVVDDNLVTLTIRGREFQFGDDSFPAMDITIRYQLEKIPDGLAVELCELDYDHESMAAEMRLEKLPEEFVETILSGWWTTCLEILPAKERAASRY